jgi:HK97 family phage major capsid protein
MRKLQERATLENRDLTAEEGQEFDRIDAEQDALGKRIIRDERMEAIRLDLNRPTSEPLRPMPGDEHRGGAPIANPRATPAYQAAFRNYLLDGPAAILTMPIAEQRNLQMDILAKGGALVAPEEFNATLIKAVDDLVFIRQFATKYTVTSAEAMGVPTLDADPADADWTSELATGSLDTTMAFGKRELKPHPLAKQVKASNKLLRASAIGPEALVRDRLAYKFAVTEEKTFLTGSGNQQPLGLFTASADGVPTSRDVSTGNTATAITADGLIEAKYTLKAAYWPRARWIFSTTAVKNVRKLKDGNGQYLWAPGLAGGTPDTILDVPYSVSEYAPATFTTGLYVGLIGDLSKYWIVDALTLTVQRLVELYAATNQTGFIGRAEVDGAPVLAEAFVRVKLA